ncbi:MAG TPA: YggS family pyridoxal phosphate enzyme [Solirubrobacteraceae bacterium]|nr:YggS family pyridoxal phosphate enzyme [Solirubrobacteraceae bacterium]
MVDLITQLRAETVAANLARVREAIADAGRDPDGVEILAAVKYLPAECLAALAEGGVRVVGENRAQQLVAKQERAGDLFTWDFIGALQSRKVRDIVARVRWIHSVASDSALTQLGRHAPPGCEILVEVNVAGELGKSGVTPAELPGFLKRSPVPVVGLMTMPPRAAAAEDSAPHFAALAELAAAHGLRELSMGTSQDYAVAAREGATIVRLGTILYESAA